MQQIVIICHRDNIFPLIDTLQQEFDVLDTLKGWGHSAKKPQGSIILEWDGTIKPEFESYLKKCSHVLDFYVSLEEEALDIIPVPIAVAV